jgi:hypothetical protein
MSSLLFYNVENGKNKETLDWVGASKALTGTNIYKKPTFSTNTNIYIYTAQKNKGNT